MATSVKMAEFPKVISLALKKKVIIFGSISVFKIIFVKGDQWVSTHFPKMITSPKDDQFFKGAVK